MGSYWAGYSGTGLILTEPEFHKMLEQYKQKNEKEKEAVNAAIENCTIGETKFIKFQFAGESMPDLQENVTGKYAGKVMYVMELCKDQVDGVTFWPFYRTDGTPNTPSKQEDGTRRPLQASHPIWDSDADRCYFLFSDKAMDTVTAFEERPYGSYQKFVQEFKDKVEGYLPNDFDWDAHLGNLSYAAYA